MQTQHKIRMQFEIHQRRATSNLAIAVEQDFALPADGLLFSGSFGSRTSARGCPAVAGFLIRIFLASSRKSSGRLTVVGSSLYSDKRNFRSEFAQSRAPTIEPRAMSNRLPEPACCRRLETSALPSSPSSRRDDPGRGRSFKPENGLLLCR